MIGDADANRGQSRGDEVGHRLPLRKQNRQRPRPERFGQSQRDGRYLSDKVVEITQARDVNDQRVKVRPLFGLEHPRNGKLVFGIGPQAIHGFRGKGDESPLAQRLRGQTDIRDNGSPKHDLNTYLIRARSDSRDNQSSPSHNTGKRTCHCSGSRETSPSAVPRFGLSPAPAPHHR